MVLLATFAVCVLSAIVPVVNAEVYLVGLRGVLSPESLWLTALAAGAGQAVGKLVWYAAGWRSMESAWVQRKLDVGTRRRDYDRWRHAFEARPLLSRVTFFASASLGLPPLLIVALLAGQLRLPLRWVFPMVLIGRTLRFAVVLGLADQLMTRLT
ncbi:membrane protein YqaA with SNARE-associated domain [Kineosphaera limosa]|uniref:SNARE associated Golgi protein n=1 Tax=Kineosphaera limosa NBRC 100340 TaxID=1184609 RepID=K6WNZ1_9MICO|nr:hypothetical protein [Kineosphaera limosa]NYD99922.1 membrane protein YqaA with SNARE-associated domain [Kineosphaera limosa]GAB95541.1 hypothetical protein KILIM_022_00250 [Kineosphaera limosa NBRC 100340]